MLRSYSFLTVNLSPDPAKCFLGTFGVHVSHNPHERSGFSFTRYLESSQTQPFSGVRHSKTKSDNNIHRGCRLMKSTKSESSTSRGSGGSGEQRPKKRGRLAPQALDRQGKRKKTKDMPKPYNLYFQEERKKTIEKYERGERQEDFLMERGKEGKDPSEALFRAVSRTVANRWKAMSDEEKKPYYDRANAEMDNYRQKMDEYNQKLIKSSDLAKKLAETQRDQIEQSKLLKKQLEAEKTGTRRPVSEEDSKPAATRRTSNEARLDVPGGNMHELLLSPPQGNTNQPTTVSSHHQPRNIPDDTFLFAEFAVAPTTSVSMGDSQGSQQQIHDRALAEFLRQMSSEPVPTQHPSSSSTLDVAMLLNQLNANPSFATHTSAPTGSPFTPRGGSQGGELADLLQQLQRRQLQLVSQPQMHHHQQPQQDEQLQTIISALSGNDNQASSSSDREDEASVSLGGSSLLSSMTGDYISLMRLLQSRDDQQQAQPDSQTLSVQQIQLLPSQQQNEQMLRQQQEEQLQQLLYLLQQQQQQQEQVHRAPQQLQAQPQEPQVLQQLLQAQPGLQALVQALMGNASSASGNNHETKGSSSQ